ncbi:hypothetical protein XENTR_v10015945 [Xenopus tropicalis]|nr:hypothetical protein XENTR_v10015945 [Xenopus tropicalis]
MRAAPHSVCIIISVYPCVLFHYILLYCLILSHIVPQQCHSASFLPAVYTMLCPFRGFLPINSVLPALLGPLSILTLWLGP